MSKKDFIKNGYTLVKNAINPELRDVITQYALFDEMQDFNPDGEQVPAAHSKYGDPAMEALLLHLHPLMEKETGLKLYPTYSFYRVYRNGDILAPHKDRPSCEISATLCLNYSYDPEYYDWPIIMDGHRFYLQPGSLVIYRGVDLEHSREEFIPPNEDWHVQAFFHYVNVDGPYSEHKFDKRESIGTISNNHAINKNRNYIKYV